MTKYKILFQTTLIQEQKLCISFPLIAPDKNKIAEILSASISF